MKKKLIDLALQHKELVLYLIFGVLTTIVSYAVYIPCVYLWKLSAALSNVISWFIAVLFAFATNKPFVFRSNDWSPKTVLPELTKFMGTRIFSGLSETVILFITVDLLHWNGLLWKLIATVVVMIMNYVGSKLLVFRKA